MILLSCQCLGSNEVRLWLDLIAYNSGNLTRLLFASKVRRIEALPVPA